MAERSVTIGIRYCGGCNPEIDRGHVVDRLKEVIRSEGVEPIFNSNAESEWVIFINGCLRACLEEEYSDIAQLPQCICVEGARLNHQPVEEEALAQAIWARMNFPKQIHRSSNMKDDGYTRRSI